MSGNVFSKHYFDMNERHMKGEYYRILTDYDEVKRASVSSYVLDRSPVPQKY